MMSAPLGKIWPLVLILVLCGPGPAGAQNKANVTFLGVALDAETKKADQKLLDYLRGEFPVQFEKRDMEYGVAINTLVNWNSAKQGPVMARVTPYVFVAAELLGADLAIMATYISRKTNRPTYHSYFVMHKSFGFQNNGFKEFVQRLSNPEEQAEELIKHLQKRKVPARFIYHSKFSTSSYFLPSLYFKQKGVFSVFNNDPSDRKFIAIHSVKPENARGSSDLVRLVKDQKADFAAVWDGTKNKFASDPDLHFIQLPYTIPNDLLVVSRTMDPGVQQKIRDAIQAMKVSDINEGDFLKWQDFNSSPKARKALASLRWLAKVPPRPVVVNIRRSHISDAVIDETQLEAARQAIRLSGTELVLYDEDFHSAFDVLWTLEQTHDDAILVTSTIMDADLTQEFFVSFRKGDMESLTARIGSIIKEKMHRIRYIWPFDNESPRVLRDVSFKIPVGQKMKAQKITWNDFNTNEYVIDTPFEVEVVKSDFHSFQLKGEGFPKKAGGNRFAFDPLSNAAYRVYLVRTEEASSVYKIATQIMIGLFSLAALFAFREVLIRPTTSNV